MAKKNAAAVAAPGPRTMRDITKQETREALLRAGMEMFSESGLDAPSLDALCARAGFTRGAFYVHFKDREDFIVAVMESATGSFLDAILATRGEKLELSQIVIAFAEAIAGGTFGAFGQVPLHQFLAACARSEALRERYGSILVETRARLAESVRAGQKSGKIRGDVDPNAAAELLMAIALGLGALLELKMPFDAQALATAVLKMVGPR